MSDSEKNMPTICCSCFTLLGMKTTYYQAFHLMLISCKSKVSTKWLVVTRIKFESYGTLFNEAYFIFNENLVDNQYHFGQMENDQTAEAFYEDDRSIDETQENGNSALSRFMPTLLPDDEIPEENISLNVKQRAAFDLVSGVGKKLCQIQGY